MDNEEEDTVLYRLTGDGGWDCSRSSDSWFLYMASTTPGNPGNLLEFLWSSWKFCIKCRWSMSMINRIGFQLW